MRTFALLLCASIPLLAVGCGGGGGGDQPDIGRVTGTVTLDGQPLPDATVMFQPDEGRASIGTTDAAGHYSLKYLENVNGAAVGHHKVMIRTEIPGNDGEPPVAKEKLPAKYHDATELTADVKTGSNEKNFELTSK